MRRSTLSNISPSQLNRGNGPGRVINSQAAKKRLTLGPGPRAPGPRPPNESRLSAGQARGSLSRRSSLYGKGSSQVKSDPRPLNDKGFQQTCIRTLITFLTQHGYDHAISPKLLTNPTSKEFIHIVHFLFRRVDPNIAFAGKIEDDVPALFKRLNYPFQISKSALYAVGSPHTWPGLLAALTWIVELLMYEERAEESREAGGSFDDNGQRLFFSFVGKAYHYFLEGDDDNCGLLEEQLSQTFQDRDADFAAEVEGLAQANAALQSELDEKLSQPAPLVALERKKGDFLSDIAKFQKLIASLQQHKQGLGSKLEERKADLTHRDAELAAVRTDNASLRERIAAQEINLADVERMSKERARMEEVLRSVSQQREALDKAVWDSEVQLAKQQEALDCVVRLYHSTGDRLKLIPKTAKRAEGMDYEVEINPRASRPEAMVNVDLKGVIKPALARLKEQASRAMREQQQAMLVLSEQKDSSSEAVGEQQEANRCQEALLKKLEAQYKAEKEKLDAELRSMAGAVESTEAAAAQMQASCGTSLADWSERLEAKLREFDEAERHHESEGNRVNGYLMGAMDMLISHKHHIELTLQSVNGQLSQVLEDLEGPVSEGTSVSQELVPAGSRAP